MISEENRFNKIYLLFFIAIIFIGIYLFFYENDRRHLKIRAEDLHVLLGDNIVRSNNKEITIKYDGNASKNIKEYSFDGGVTWTKSNIALIEDEKDIQIEIKDINDQIYSLKYNYNAKNNKVQIDKIKLLKISDNNNTLSQVYGNASKNKFIYTNAMNVKNLTIKSTLKCPRNDVSNEKKFNNSMTIKKY